MGGELNADSFVLDEIPSRNSMAWQLKVMDLSYKNDTQFDCREIKMGIFSHLPSVCQNFSQVSQCA